MVSAGTSRVTTDPAPTTAPSPIVTPGTTVTEAPSHTLRPMTIGAGSMSERRPGSTAWLSVVRVLPCPISEPSPMVMPPVSWKRQPRLTNTFLPRVRFLPNSVWKGGKSATDSSTAFPVSSASIARSSSGLR
ncbi:hypothetical protein ASE12_02575 [Aeromicrobium sp. Root236]|nr:hypothetical protein ASE12_02575 [Aeromicrobium sp. Root236]